ncbi:hypothetical protein PF005_g5960 [Phytophthora fragariae]|nr:hypothetical protein PF003_g37499 [Phytophthora fragariae]KAE8943562.1 hypothetical protein PF009_g6716 [Phytophthora fragariae]KAE9020523.1 hypothetical protein PF011_g5371 [Phytophthora fragariae]KAE9125902.1 hypothetical protein PF007_g6179 [Phytophthora fragariae]KAE9129769.1 hypothetical protein PF010_g4068 [Phytophthora fragariae]
MQGDPKQGALQICMKYLSKNGCTGIGEPGKCISSKRAHFRPSELSDVVKDYIVKKFGDLAHEFADLRILGSRLHIHYQRNFRFHLSRRHLLE